MSDLVAKTVVAVDVADVASDAAVMRPLRVRDKALYAAGDAVEGTVTISIATFFLFYLTAVCGLSPTLAGFAMFLTLLVDAFVDPFVGYLTDNTRSRLGRRHPFLVGCALPLGVALALLFSIPSSLEGPALFAYVIIVLMLVRVLQSGFVLPFAALGAELSRDYTERSSIAAFRFLLNNIANATVLVLGFGVFMRGDAGLLDRSAYSAFGWTCGAIVLLAALACFGGTLSLRGRMQPVRATGGFRFKLFVRELTEAARNRSFVLLFFTVMVFWVAQGMALVLTLHSNKFFWGLPPEVLETIPIFDLMGSVSGVPITIFLLRRFQKQHVCIAGVVLFCLAQFLPATLRVLGLLPEAGPPLHDVIYGVRILIGWSLSAAYISFGSMMADCADEHDHLFGQRREGLFFAGTLFSTKAAIAVGSLVAGASLDLIRFPRDVAALGPDPVIAAETLRNLGLISGPGAASIAVLCVFFLAAYSLGPKRLSEIQEALARRRGETG